MQYYKLPQDGGKKLQENNFTVMRAIEDVLILNSGNEYILTESLIAEEKCVMNQNHFNCNFKLKWFS